MNVKLFTCALNNTVTAQLVYTNCYTKKLLKTKHWTQCFKLLFGIRIGDLQWPDRHSAKADAMWAHEGCVL